MKGGRAGGPQQADVAQAKAREEMLFSLASWITFPRRVAAS